MEILQGLLYRNVQLEPEATIPGEGNRLLASFSNLPNSDLESISEAIQPAFQKAGYAPDLFVKWEPGDQGYEQVTINAQGHFTDLLLSKRLFIPGHQLEANEQAIDSFISLCSECAEEIERVSSRSSGWFRRLSGKGASLAVIPQFNRTREQATKIAWRLGSFMKNLPRYQRTIEILIEDHDVSAEDIEEFIDFIGLKDAQKPSLGVWVDDTLALTFKVTPNFASFRLTSVPRTPSPAQVVDNLREIARRFSSEFGGTIREQNHIDQIIKGWEAVLKQVDLRPGSDLTRDLFAPRD